MRFLHISDCHLGGWKNEKLEELNFRAFCHALDEGIKNDIDAIIIAGDFFDIPIPSPKIFVKVVKKLKEVVNRGVKIYAIEGSHDVANEFGIINFLEAAEIIKNVDFRKSNDINYFIDGDLFIVGLAGKKRGKEVYEIEQLKEFLEKHREKFVEKKKILVIHSNIQEISDIPGESISINSLPNYFDYYALGHIHEKKILKKSNRTYLYPGPIFPTNFEEFERIKGGSGFIVDLEKKELREIPINVCDVLNIKINANRKNPFSLTEEILEELKKNDIKDKVITLRIEGTMEKGSTGQIDFARINEIVENYGSILLRNTSKLHSKEFEIKEIEPLNYDINNIEREFIKKLPNYEIIFELMDLLDKEKIEGETNAKFEERILGEIKKKEDAILEKLKC
jgi:DNA repair exonuclease SbcCD nuclease subunit